MSYQYWIIRFVPNIARGEFTNVGLVCGRDGGDWAVGFDPRYVRNHGNLSSDLRELTNWITWFRRTVEHHGSVGFGQQRLDRATALTSGELRPVLRACSHRRCIGACRG